MRIHTYIRMAWNGREYVTVEEIGFDYSGPVSRCYGYGAVVVAVLAAATTAYSQYEQARYDTQVGQYNEKMAQYEADQQRAKGEIELAEHRERVKRLKGSQKVAILKSGMSLGSGTALELLADTEQQAAWDEKIIKWNTDAGVWGKNAEGSLALAEGRQRATQGYLRMGSSLLSNVSKFDYSKSNGLTLRSG